ncbi:MAG: hypothetical protein II822_04495 [Prevotella sp.]|nr:hypothetical protein [Prevotella sp.]
MTEKEIIERQELNCNREYFLILVGRFLHAYGNGAFALARATGYRVMRKQRKWGEVLTLGFPIDMFDRVRDRIRDAGGDVESIDDKTWVFRNLDGMPDPQMVCEPRPKVNPAPAHPLEREESGCAGKANQYDWLAEAVWNFNLSASTPMEAMLFVRDLQQRLHKEEKASPAVKVSGEGGTGRSTPVIACGSPSGQGLAE